ncbi:MAG: hypothetical protein JJV98_14145 [Desulfosarcina sp.]|nr:hypothetical protein [Desulfobacterales bacterium]
MTTELAVLVIHGMGSQSPDFADEMIDELNGQVSDIGKDAGAIAWRTIYWADILEGRQLKYLRDAKRSGDIDFVSLRKFILTSIGDASAYQKVESGENTVYKEIHLRVSAAIQDIYVSDLGSQPKPMIVLAHSLGGHIMSNYIWDKQHSTGTQLSGFERMKHLVGFVTFGCNIPLFTFAYQKVVPIAFPPPKLPTHLKKKAKWLNFYDPDDVLGYPLKAINPDYRKVVSKDIPINVGGILSSWNPMSHTKYWTDNDLTKPVSKFISKFL